MTRVEFEHVLTLTVQHLTASMRTTPFVDSRSFENGVRQALQMQLGAQARIDLDPNPQAFPDIIVGRFGVEVKFTDKDSWRCIANSVFESTRDQGVEELYVVFGKQGGQPEARFARYENCVMHVRTSHVPRFEIEIGTLRPLFSIMAVDYDTFRRLPLAGKMKYIRRYARGRLKRGEHLWWLDDSPDGGHTLPLEVQLYMNLSQPEKRRLRAEAALLCPQVLRGSRVKGKYNDAVIYLMTYRGVFCPQARDLFSAGSVALRRSSARGGNYLQRAIEDIQEEMQAAARELEDALFVEYWGESVPPDQRIKQWLLRADSNAVGWRPSGVLFLQ